MEMEDGVRRRMSKIVVRAILWSGQGADYSGEPVGVRVNMERSLAIHACTNAVAPGCKQVGPELLSEGGTNSADGMLR